MSSARPEWTRRARRTASVPTIATDTTAVRDPDGKIARDVARRIVDPGRLRQRGDHRQAAGRRERRRPIAAEHRAARHLAADFGNLVQRPLEILHGARPSLYNAKYTRMES